MVWTAPPGRDLNVNLVVLAAGERIAEHTNDALDVLVVVLAGEGTARVDGTDVPLRSHEAVLIPKGARRGIAAGDGLRYMTVHIARPPMQIGHPR